MVRCKLGSKRSVLCEYKSAWIVDIAITPLSKVIAVVGSGWDLRTTYGIFIHLSCSHFIIVYTNCNRILSQWSLNIGKRFPTFSWLIRRYRTTWWHIYRYLLWYIIENISSQCWWYFCKNVDGSQTRATRERLISNTRYAIRDGNRC